MLAWLEIVAGLALLVYGTIGAMNWVGGRNRWIDPGVVGREGKTKTDRQFLLLYFVVLVVAPMLAGAVLVALGIKQW